MTMVRKPKPFFIFGLPRSRTAWLSVFMTTDRSICYHEVTSEINSIDDLDRYLEDPSYDHVGFSDTILALGWKQIRNKYPQAPIVVVTRDFDDVQSSLTRLSSDPDMAKKMCPLLIKTQECLSSLIEDGARHVNFESIPYVGICRMVMEYLAPKVIYDPVRWTILERMNIQCDLDQLNDRVKDKIPQITRFVDSLVRS